MKRNYQPFAFLAIMAGLWLLIFWVAWATNFGGAELPKPTSPTMNEAQAIEAGIIELETAPAMWAATETASPSPEPTTAPEDCSYEFESSYGTITDVAGNDEKKYYGGDWGYVIELTCNDGEIYGGAIGITLVQPDEIVYFATGNECTVSKDGLGAQWLDVYASGRHLPIGGVTPFSRCDYFPAPTPTSGG